MKEQKTEQQEYNLYYDKRSVFKGEFVSERDNWHKRKILASTDEQATASAAACLDDIEMRSASRLVYDAYLITPNGEELFVPEHSDKKRLPKNIDTIIFDLGNVLANGGHRQFIIALGDAYAEKEHAAWQNYKIGKCSENDYWKRIFADTSLEGYEEGIAKLMREFFSNSQKGKAYRFLQPLKEKNYQMAILSNHSSEWANIVVDTLHLRDYCNPILISADIGLAKPDHLIYTHTLQAVNRVHAPHKCLFIDDKIENILAARTAGMKTVHFEADEKQTAEEKLEKELRNY
ncbi:MAG: HAD-IA family hydrolase [Candidatus Aenigmarchaeota archaeon]|nr:HAD-IA family hydrolase [Candidatus Aenigmarchaeota archaeon]